MAPSADPGGEDEVQGLVAAALASSGGADLLVVDGPALFGAAAGEQALLACMQASWDVTRAVANEAMIEHDGGLVVVIAPAPGAGEHAEAARAGLENLARTLSIEWARFATRAVAIARGDATDRRRGRRAGLLARLAGGRLLLGLPAGSARG